MIIWGFDNIKRDNTDRSTIIGAKIWGFQKRELVFKSTVGEGKEYGTLEVSQSIVGTKQNKKEQVCLQDSEESIFIHTSFQWVQPVNLLSLSFTSLLTSSSLEAFIQTIRMN